MFDELEVEGLVWAVDFIAYDGELDILGVGTDLVLTAGVEGDGSEGVDIIGGDGGEGGLGVFGFFDVGDGLFYVDFGVIVLC